MVERNYLVGPARIHSEPFTCANCGYRATLHIAGEPGIRYRVDGPAWTVRLARMPLAQSVCPGCQQRPAEWARMRARQLRFSILNTAIIGVGFPLILSFAQGPTGLYGGLLMSMVVVPLLLFIIIRGWRRAGTRVTFEPALSG